MKIKLFLLFLWLFGAAQIWGQESNNSIKTGFMGSGLDAPTSQAVLKLLKDQGYLVKSISDQALITKGILNDDFTHLWIHQMNVNATAYRGKKVGKVIQKFVREGGNLILSMEAVRLLNEWGIEKNSFQIKKDTVTDNGFGRPRGFHAFKSHPIFAGMHGGSYPWKSKEDHIVRKIGFFNQQLPDTTIAKVIGTEWTYITFHEDNKLVIEYNLGKGKIIAIGAFSYFGKENYNTPQLHRFYTNIFEYTAGNINDVKPNYWNYSPQRVIPFEEEFSTIEVPEATKWNLPKTTIEFKKEEADENVVILAGRRMMAVGKEKDGMDEIWTSPFMAFRDLATGILLKDADEVIWLSELSPSLTSSPEMLIREYTVKGNRLREITVVSIDKPIGVVHYEWEGTGISKIFLKYSSNFRYMWPYSERVASTIRYKWAPELNAAVASAQSDELVSMMGFSSKPENALLGQYSDFKFKNRTPNGIKTDIKQVSGIFGFDVEKANGKLNAYMLAGENGLDKTLENYRKEAKNFNSMFEKTSEHYQDLIDNRVMLNTPDEKFNMGYRWALLRSDQFFQNTPGIGTTMVAGLGTTERGWDGGQKVSGRPGYSWYFGRDAQWCAFAVNAYGGHEQVKKMLEVFAKFQNLNGKIFHELTTSGAVHFDASDSTPLYVVLAAHYLKYSGDVEFIKKLWPSLKKAMDFCYSTDTDGDGLIEITNVGHGWIEGGSLFPTHTELYLAGTWAAALNSASYLADVVQKKDLSASYQKDAETVKNSIDNDFWDKDDSYFYVGKMKDGSFMKEESILSGVPIYFDVITDDEKAYKTAASFASNGYSTDWGVRILPENSKNYNPKSYHGGMVWPLFGGWAALAEYKTGNFASGYTHIMNNLLVYEDWNLGSVEETLDGMTYSPAGVCSQQGWSETMVLQPIYEGMLGLAPDALDHSISLSPNFPWNWNKVNVENISFGDHKIVFEMVRNEKSTNFHFEEKGGKNLDLNFSTNLPLGTIVKMVKINGVDSSYETFTGSESIRLTMDPLELGTSATIEVLHEKGIGVLPLINHVNPGDTNDGAKIVNQQLSDRTYEVVIEGLPDKTYLFEILSNMEISDVRKGRVIKSENNIYTIETVMPYSSKKYVQQKVSFNLKK